MNRARGDIADRYMDAWNRQDAEGIRACFTRDGYYIDSIHEREVIGDEIIAYAENSFEKYPDMHYEIINRTASGGSNLAVQWVMTGSNVEAMFGLPVSNRDVSLTGLDFLTLYRGRIRTCISYYDVSSMGRGVDRKALIGRGTQNFNKYERARLSDDTVAQIRGRLMELVEREEVYADPDMSLTRLAAALEISPTYLSQVVNRAFGLNFRDYINSLRVQHAQSLLRDPARADEPVIQIGLSVGFNSPSVFYSAFRKFTGMTPLNWRTGAR